MSMSQQTIKFIQQQISSRFNIPLVADGIAGRQTVSSLLFFSTVSGDWNTDRRLVGALQHLITVNDIDCGAIDGYWGPSTQNGYHQLKHKLDTGLFDLWRDKLIGLFNQDDQPQQPVSAFPTQDYQSMVGYYGPVGTNQTKVQCAYPLKLAWAPQTVITRFTCHEKVKDSIERVLQKVLDHYGLHKIEQLGLDLWGGCLNVRKMRGGTKYSTHSWGVAIDWDPARNQLRWNKDKANFAKCDYDYWWKCWEDEGWVSLGRTKNYDWMHIQACISE